MSDVPAIVVSAVTVLVLFVGVALGWWWRGWSDRDEAERIVERLRDGER